MGHINKQKMHSWDLKGKGSDDCTHFQESKKPGIFFLLCIWFLSSVMQFLPNENTWNQFETIIQEDKLVQPRLKIKKCKNRNHGSSEEIISNGINKYHRKGYTPKKKEETITSLRVLYVVIQVLIDQDRGKYLWCP